MTDAWGTFPARMGDHQAFISFNHSFAEIAEGDPRTSLLSVRVPLARPTPEGLPAGDEFADLAKIEDLLDAAIAAKGGVQVGRITADGNRDFLFYVPFDEAEAAEIVDALAEQTTYSLQYAHQDDPDKEAYWQTLYPTDDDRQIMHDMQVLDELRKKGDTASVSRRVMHWAFFPDPSDAHQFADWAEAKGYPVESVAPTEDGRSAVRFSHEGTMALADITRHTVAISREARSLGGEYDGWETSVEQAG
ncbi:hypothetical protein GQ57_15415 [Burkholderia sp. MSh2]|uniref:DUF695 domain-containing protein n=1 Tax=Burkholderia paludis TaxID=1506587 RepID=A0A6J5D0S1_9BURK|nr:MULTISPECIES: DUF695 domain-containing protein [Burkholderia]KEZ04945.1 hypothetical protein GQ57_15415 [Burkholderia sp. MSh2]CAB3746832.1 hypothetical protein LMG30113_00293 [Burkholderia paludis]VWB26790.1 hypothetical protein BPA30113_00978 [Burkholderia paludis]